MKYLYVLPVLFLLACSSGQEILKEKTIINERKIDIPERVYSGKLNIVSDSIPNARLYASNSLTVERNKKNHIRVRGKIDTASNTLILDIIVPADSVRVADTTKTIEKKETKEVTNYKTTFYIIFALLTLLVIILYFIKK